MRIEDILAPELVLPALTATTKAGVLEELAAARKSASEGGSKLKAELDTLQSERKQVRTRIEKLLGVPGGAIMFRGTAGGQQ